MTEYQIKLAKLYAELIGVDIFDEDDGRLFTKSEECDGWIDLKTFNPFIGQLQLDARDSFDVDIYHSLSCVNIDDLSGLPFVSWVDSSIEAAVIECILKSKGII